MVIKGAGYIKVATVRYVLRLICGYPEHKSWTHDGKQVIKDIFSNKTWMSMYQCVMTERYGDDFVAYYKASLTSGTYFYGLRFTNSVLWKSSQFIEQIKNDDLKFARKLKKTKNKTEEQLIIELITRKCRYSDIARSTYYKLKPHEFIARQQKKKKKRKKNTNDTKETTEIKKPETKPTVTYSNSATSSNSISYTSSSQPFINPDSYAQSEVTQGTHSNYNTPYHPPFMHQHPDAAFYEAFYHFHLQKEKNGMMNHQNDVNHQNENIPSPMFDETQTNDITIESNFYENSNVSPPNEETMQNSMIHNLSISIDNDDTMPNSMENEDTMANEEAMQPRYQLQESHNVSSQTIIRNTEIEMQPASTQTIEHPQPSIDENDHISEIEFHYVRRRFENRGLIMITFANMGNVIDSARADDKELHIIWSMNGGSNALDATSIEAVSQFVKTNPSCCSKVENLVQTQCYESMGNKPRHQVIKLHTSLKATNNPFVHTTNERHVIILVTTAMRYRSDHIKYKSKELTIVEKEQKENKQKQSKTQKTKNKKKSKPNEAEDVDIDPNLFSIDPKVFTFDESCQVTRIKVKQNAMSIQKVKSLLECVNTTELCMRSGLMERNQFIEINKIKDLKTKKRQIKSFLSQIKAAQIKEAKEKRKMKKLIINSCAFAFYQANGEEGCSWQLFILRDIKLLRGEIFIQVVSEQWAGWIPKTRILDEFVLI
eukprot:496044_1